MLEKKYWSDNFDMLLADFAISVNNIPLNFTASKQYQATDINKASSL